MHISELAEHHVETPSEVVQPGQETWVRILEIDEERRRISLSVKRAQRNDNLPLRDLIPPELQPGNEPAPEPESGVPDLDLSEEVFSEPAPADPQPPAEQAVEETAAEDVVEETTPEAAAEETVEAEQAPADEAPPADAASGPDEPSQAG